MSTSNSSVFIQYSSHNHWITVIWLNHFLGSHIFPDILRNFEEQKRCMIQDLKSTCFKKAFLFFCDRWTLMMTAVCWWVIGQTVLKAGRVPLLGAVAATSWDSITKAQGSLSNSASAGSMQESPHLVRLGFLFLSLAKSENTVNSQKKHHYILGMKYKCIFLHINYILTNLSVKTFRL